MPFVMPAFINKKSLLYIGGALLLAVLGDAVWEFLVRPSLLAAQDILLNLSTLGIQRFKDSMYVDIAKGRYDRASTELLGQHFALFTAILLVAPFALFRISRKLREQPTKFKEEVRALDPKSSGRKTISKEELLAPLERAELRFRKIDRTVPRQAQLDR